MLGDNSFNVSRIEAVMRRFRPNAPQIPDELSLGDIAIDFKTHTVMVRGKKMKRQ